MINTQTRSDETSGESSPGDVTEYVNLLGPSRQESLQKSPYTVQMKKFSFVHISEEEWSHDTCDELKSI